MGLAGLKHVSVRVPWHDNGWNGRVCLDPKGNAACLAIRRNAANRDDDYEQQHASECFSTLEKTPPCLGERGTFLSPKSLLLESVLDYSRYSPDHRHILPASVQIPAYGGTLTPFRWMLREHAFDIAADRGLEASLSLEPKAGEAPALVVDTPWVQNHVNQCELLNGFAKELSDTHSLVFFYAPQTPMSDGGRRQIVAVAKLSYLGSVEEYPYEGQNAGTRIRSVVWERPFQHTLRRDADLEGVWTGGVVLPYQQLLELAKSKEFDPSEFIAEVPADGIDQFLYASEHVTHGNAISALLSVRNALERTRDVMAGPWDRYIDWIDGELSALWKMHGLAPGLGSALSLVGGKFNGTLFAQALAAEIEDEVEPWPIIEQIFAGTRAPPPKAPIIKPMQIRRFEDTKTNDPNRYEFLKLLSRFELSRDQAKQIDEYVSDPALLLENPYRLFELTRRSSVPIGFSTIDRSLYPDNARSKRAAFPSTMKVDLDDPEDAMRLRAILVDVLDRAAIDGHTVLPAEQLISRLKEMPLATGVDIDEQVIRLCKAEFEPEIHVTQHDDHWQLQLNHYRDAGVVIREHVRARLSDEQATQIEWASKIEAAFGVCAPGDADEISAQQEKAVALQTLECSRLAVLTGPAGTGKTTLLKILLEQTDLVGRDILLLAPTGKARVRLGNQTGRPAQAQTLAQFLFAQGRYDTVTGEYRFDATGETAAVSTCIIDECSMLTEDQLAALMSALPQSARLILVGDPQQLPPIGAGRPFVDIIHELKDKHGGIGLAELQVSRRQGQGDKMLSGLSLPDVQLANLFSGRPQGPGEDAVVSAAETPNDDDRLRFVSWDSPSDLREKILQVLNQQVGKAGCSLEQAIDLSLGAERSGNHLYFNAGSGEKAEGWQILSAHRNQGSGSAEINRLIKLMGRAGRLTSAQSRRGKWRVVKPRGSDRITYGDKVICLRNHKRTCYHREAGKRPGYLANGEVGMVVGDAGVDSKPYWTRVEFASQLGDIFSFGDKDFSEEKSPTLELAYAVTVHKAQGSEFGCVILVLPANSRLLSREMLYTALTRQKDRVWILHQGPFNHYLKLASDFFSETARRSTNLFNPPTMTKIEMTVAGGSQSMWLSEHLIHKTQRGDLVRSKSEVIIADMLHGLEQEGRLRYSYEKPLQGTGGDFRLPDFTIETEKGNWYWEHCGMLGLPDYARRWREKQDWYKAQGIEAFSQSNPEGRLIISEDALNGGIDSSLISELAKGIFS